MRVSLDNRFGADYPGAAAVLDGLTHALQGMFTKELQDPHITPHAGRRAVVLFQLGTKHGEAGRQLPVAVHWRMVECSGLAFQRREIVDWIGDHRASLHGPRVRCD